MDEKKEILEFIEKVTELEKKTGLVIIDVPYTGVCIRNKTGTKIYDFEGNEV
ncbi:hypothetical protein [Priestia megaterium]|uniref:hypothetical protein n=1 Tax=Priestia megaterium TaxID=1404 RepID=UPI001ABFD411|nr:hypothetical protein [Priestia megaterium]